jgi:molecular chaperone DnaK
VSRILGIDLGTTNSCVAVVEETGKARVLPNREGSRTTPSVVAFGADGSRTVGAAARRQALTNPQNTVFAVKRLIGRKFQDPTVQDAMNGHLPYQLVAAENGDVKVDVLGRALTPQEISAIVLQELKSAAEEVLGAAVTEAVITVPAYFDDAQRQATRDAGKIAGLEVKRIINEPTAAALAYGLDRRADTKAKSRHIAVYDLGGGTFDISILELSDGVFAVKASNGDSHLGGEDFDHKVMDWLIQEFQAESGIDVRTDNMALQRLKEAAEAAKCDLSANPETQIKLPFLASAGDAPKHLERTLDRPHFEDLVRELVLRTKAPCLDALEQAGLRPEQIDEVLLVGGQTRTPLVAELVKGLFGREPNAEINPDEVVAVGAAMQGGIMSGEVEDVVLLDVTPLSLGIETRGGIFTRLIERNSVIPTKVTEVFTTVMDYQDKVELHILQGERQMAEHNRSLGKIELIGLPAEPKGVPQIEVTFAIDSNSIHTVSARDLATGREQSLVVNPTSGISPEEVERLVKEADKYAQEDIKRKEVRRVRNRLEGLIQNNQKVLAQFRKTLKEEDVARVEQVVSQARHLLETEDKLKMESAIVELGSVSQMLSDLMLNRR